MNSVTQAAHSKRSVFLDYEPYLAMPPKFNPDDPETAELIMLFQTIGFSKAKATETAKNAKNASALKEIIQKNDLSSRNVDDKKGSLLAGLASQGSKLGGAEKQYAIIHNGFVVGSCNLFQLLPHARST